MELAATRFVVLEFHRSWRVASFSIFDILSLASRKTFRPIQFLAWHRDGKHDKLRVIVPMQFSPACGEEINLNLRMTRSHDAVVCNYHLQLLQNNDLKLPIQLTPLC